MVLIILQLTLILDMEPMLLLLSLVMGLAILLRRVWRQMPHSISINLNMTRLERLHGMVRYSICFDIHGSRMLEYRAILGVLRISVANTTLIHDQRIHSPASMTTSWYYLLQVMKVLTGRAVYLLRPLPRMFSQLGLQQVGVRALLLQGKLQASHR